MSQPNPQFSSHRIWLAILPTILYAAVLPYIIYKVASPYMSNINALLLAAIPPAVATLFGLLRTRHINLISALALLGIAIQLISALAFKDPRLVLASSSFLTGIYGILMLGSVLIGKPLLLTLAKSFLTPSSSAQTVQPQPSPLDARRTFFLIITAIWGVGLTLSLIASIIFAYTMSAQQFLAINPIIQYGTFFTLLLGSQIYGFVRRSRQKRQPQDQSQETTTVSA